MSYLNLEEQIQVKSGDYKREWLNAKVTSVHKGNFGEIGMSVKFEDGSSQYVDDIFGIGNEEWRYFKKEFSLGEEFITRAEIHFPECMISKGTTFEIIEILEDGNYKVHFKKCIYDEEFKNQCIKMNCEPSNEDGNIQICNAEDINNFTVNKK